MQAFIHAKSTGSNGEHHSFYTVSVDAKVNPLWWQTKGLMYTSTGYGKRIPTQYMVRFNAKWRRVYCCQYSNNGTLYIGKLGQYETLIVDINVD